MIELKGVSHKFAGPSGERVVLEDVDLTLERGESVALMGANGSGKSTLCRCLNGLLLPARGTVSVDGLPTDSAGAAPEIRRRVGMIFQDPSQQLVTWSVEEEIAFGPANLGRGPREVGAAVEAALREWALHELRARHPQSLSGGQMAALAVASVLAMNPSYLVVDEPSSMLDRPGRLGLRRAIDHVRTSGEVGVLWVTQFPEEAAWFDRLVIMSGGRIVADGDPGELLVRAAPLAAWGLTVPPAACLSRKLMELGVPVGRTHVGMKELIEDLDSLGVRPPRPAHEEDAARRHSPPILCLEDVGFRYGEDEAGVEGISLSLRPGEGMGLVGPSGSGKSTVAFLACGALEPSSGSVEPPSPERGFGLASQFPEEQFCVTTVEGETALGLRGRGWGPAKARLRAYECLAALGLDPEDMGSRSPLGLSEGEKRKVALASALAAEGSVLVLDEPTLGLDGPSTEKALEAVIGHIERGGAALIASHSGDFLFRTASSLALLRGGRYRGPMRWLDVLTRIETYEELPEGQLPQLARWSRAAPPRDDLRSSAAVIEWYARRLTGSFGPSSGPSGGGSNTAPIGLRSRSNAGKCA